MDKKVLLMILDGWGEGRHDRSNAIYTQGTPNLDRLRAKYPVSFLKACGEDVGLPEGQMGNSEVGHLNIGAGRIVYQDLVKINRACAQHKLLENKEIKAAYDYVAGSGKALHFFGLCSHGGVHSSLAHLYEFLEVAAQYRLPKVYVHCFMDGRDCDPRSGKGFIEELQAKCAELRAKYPDPSQGPVIASIIGRYYAMDRDKRWDRIKMAYDLVVNGEGEKFSDPVAAMQKSYDEGVTDEFIKPHCGVDAAGKPLGLISEGDAVIFYNFRNDRAREITAVLTQQDMPEQGMRTIPLYYCCLTPYDDKFTGLHGESRILINSPKVATYDLKPEMSAPEVTEALVAELNKGVHDMVILNFANGDMVGHTGVYEAIRKAVKTVDECVAKVVDAARANGYSVLITADHGNADHAVNEDGSPNTAHSLNVVPFIAVDDDVKALHNGRLADIAPTMLKLMGIPAPADMTGEPLF